MKTIILSLFLLTSLNSFSQDTSDSAYIKNFSLQARLTAYITPYVFANVTNDSLFTVFIKWRQAQRQNFVTGASAVVIDSIPTVELAGMYNYVLGGSDGFNAAAIMRSQLSAIRTAHPYLDRLCTAFETSFTVRLQQIINNGYILQRGR